MDFNGSSGNGEYCACTETTATISADCFICYQRYKQRPVSKPVKTQLWDRHACLSSCMLISRTFTWIPVMCMGIQRNCTSRSNSWHTCRLDGLMGYLWHQFPIFSTATYFISQHDPITARANHVMHARFPEPFAAERTPSKICQRTKWPLTTCRANLVRNPIKSHAQWTILHIQLDYDMRN